jgi:hypothetical protein
MLLSLRACHIVSDKQHVQCSSQTYVPVDLSTEYVTVRSKIEHGDACVEHQSRSSIVTYAPGPTNVLQNFVSSSSLHDALHVLISIHSTFSIRLNSYHAQGSLSLYGSRTHGKSRFVLGFSFTALWLMAAWLLRRQRVLFRTNFCIAAMDQNSAMVVATLDCHLVMLVLLS